MQALILLTFITNMNCMKTFANPYGHSKNFSAYTTAYQTYSYRSDNNQYHPILRQVRGQYNPSSYNVPLDFGEPSQGFGRNPHYNHDVHKDSSLHGHEHYGGYPSDRESKNYESFYPVQGDQESSEYRVQARRASSSDTSHGRNSDSIVYPQSNDTPDETPSRITNRNCVYDLCEDVEDYPSDRFRNLFEGTTEFDSFFNNSVITLAPKGVGSPENICSSYTNITFPKTAINTKNQTRYIANVDQYKQAVKVETCSQTGGQCKFSDFWPKTYESVCEQRYTIVPLVTLGDEKLIVDTFPAPSCCVCTYKIA